MSHLSIPQTGLSNIQNAIDSATQFINQYYPKLASMKKNGYDGGVSVIVALLINKYQLGLKHLIPASAQCHNLVFCAQNMYPDIKNRYYFNVNDHDIFQLPFLETLYLTGSQIEDKYAFIQGLNDYYQNYQHYPNKGIISFFEIFNQNYHKFINLGLAFYALEQDHPEMKNHPETKHPYRTLFQKVISGLWSVFQNEAQLESQYLDPLKAMALWILSMLDQVDETHQFAIESYLDCVVKEQATNGQWINSDLFDGNNLVNDILLTSVCLINLISYQQQFDHHSDAFLRQQYPVNQTNMVEGKLPKDNGQEYGLTAIEAFQNRNDNESEDIDGNDEDESGNQSGNGNEDGNENNFMGYSYSQIRNILLLISFLLLFYLIYNVYTN